jgi:hypothetical protein
LSSQVFAKSKTLLYFKALMEREIYMGFFAAIFCRAAICNYCNVYMGVFGFLYMGLYITLITLDSIYGFLNM